ncbi:MAG TPA: GNAT family N-acetyltransferase [Candidatus Limnocylindrales bacterium]|nr:GNAT family N-acetyltransferase [Candidatus Limnocylindrales bacterium]
MEVLRSSSVAAFLDHAGEFLAEREAEHNLIFGILSNLQADPSQYDEPPYLATIVHGDRVVGAAIRTPPWRLVLSEVDHPGAVHRLAEDLAGTPLPGVVGPSDAAAHFSEAWAERERARPRLNRHERAFRLSRVVPPSPTTGEMILARPEHHALLTDWIAAFHDEASIGNPGQDYARMARSWIDRNGRSAYLWVDGGRPVSLTGAGGLTPHGIRVGPVYTPREDRGRGYASNLVARVSQELLDSGRTFVFLFTDLANPTSNKIYQAIGYEPVSDVDEWEFD